MASNNEFTSTFNTMTEMLQMLDESIMENQKSLHAKLDELGYNDSLVDEFAYFTKKQMEEFTPSILMSMYQKHKNGKVTLPEDYDEAVAIIKDTLLNLYEDCSTFINLYNNRVSAQKEVEKVITEYGALLNSPEMKQREENSYKEMIKKLETTTDPIEKNKIKKTIESLKMAKSLSFLTERLDKLGEKEIASIMEQFFTVKLNTYVFNKYSAKMKQIKYNPDIFRKFMDLEENFCGEDYYPYNNLFLFVVMRFIAYADMSNTSDKYFVQTILSKLTKLVYHRFETNEEELIFINIIKKVDDKFSINKEFFDIHNDSNPNGSFRSDLRAKRDEETLTNIKAIYIENGYDDIPEDVKNNPDGLAGIVKAGKELQEFSTLKKWFKQYEIDIPEDATLDDLRVRRTAMKDSVTIINNPVDPEIDGKAETMAATLTGVETPEDIKNTSTEEDKIIVENTDSHEDTVELSVEDLGIEADIQ